MLIELSESVIPWSQSSQLSSERCDFEVVFANGDRANVVVHFSVTSYPASVFTEISEALSDWVNPPDPSPNVHIKLEDGAKLSCEFSNNKTDFHMTDHGLATLNFSRSSDDATSTVSRLFISAYPPFRLAPLP